MPAVSTYAMLLLSDRANTGPTTPTQNRTTMSLRDKTAQIAVLTAIQNVLKDALETAKKGELRDDLIDFRKETGGKTVDIILPGMGKVGRVTLNESFGGVKVEVVNPTAYADWLSMHHPGSTHWVLTVKPAFQTAHLEALIEGANTDTGEVVDPSLAEDNAGVAPRVPGVRAVLYVSEPTHPTVSVDKPSQKRIFEAFRSQSVRELLPAEADRKVETPADVVEGEVVPNKPVVWTAQELKDAKRPQLREECDRLGLDNVGGVAELRKRIAAKQAELAGGAE